MKLPLSQIIYALLFTTGDTWRFSELKQTLSITNDELNESLKHLSLELENFSVLLIVHNETVALVTRPDYKEFLVDLEKAESIKEFSKGSLETLTLVAYKGPISKSDIDYIRGVNSQFMLRNLVLRGMIEKVIGKNRGEYTITIDALRYLGVESVDQLPNYEKFSQEIEKRLPVENSIESTDSE
jgi:segregation and condensation protein B